MRIQERLGRFFAHGSVVAIAVAVVAATAVTSAGAQNVSVEGPAVMHAVSCLAGNARIDTNIVNIGTHSSVYRLEFEGLTAREITVEAQDWGRIPITGRADGSYTAVVKRDGAVISQELLTTTCNTEAPQVDTDEVRVINACRDGFGYVILQFVNASTQPKPYIIEFDGVANRSTTAQAFGASVRAVTGRPPGTYNVAIRTGSTPVESFDITVDCTPEQAVETELSSGQFIDLAHPTSGRVVVIEKTSGERVLRFEGDFVSDPGPDLDIYLSAGTSANGDNDTFITDFVNLGDMVSITGAQEYVIPAGLDLSLYNTVSVWCVAFGVAFGAADLAA